MYKQNEFPVGIEFMEANWRAATDDENEVSPIGFNIIFPGMIEYAKELDLTLPLPPSSLNALLRIRAPDSEIMRLITSSIFSHSILNKTFINIYSDAMHRQRNWEYVAEGLGDSCNWNQIILKHQSRNGSLFNSPATTAAAAIHCRDDNCFDYLISVVNKCNGWGTPYIYHIYPSTSSNPSYLPTKFAFLFYLD